MAETCCFDIDINFQKYASLYYTSCVIDYTPTYIIIHTQRG